MKDSLNYLLQNVHKIGELSLLSALLSFPAAIFSDIILWATINKDYLNIILFVIAADHLLGTMVHGWWIKDFSIKKNLIGLAMKILVVIVMGGLFEGLSVLTSSQDFVFTYLKLVTRILIFLYPFRSAMLNCHIITSGKFPPKVLIDRTNKFNETLEIKELAPEENNNNNQ